MVPFLLVDLIFLAANALKIPQGGWMPLVVGALLILVMGLAPRHAHSGLAPKSEMPRWQERLFIWLARAANDASQYFGIPSGRAVEVGTQTTV